MRLNRWRLKLSELLLKKVITQKVIIHSESNQIFGTLGSFVEVLTPGPMISFVFDDSIGNLLGFNEILLWGKYNLSDNPVDISSFDNNFIETGIAQGLIFRGRRTGIIHNFTMDVDLGYKNIEKICGGIQ